MKALSIRAPWWWFILNIGKDIENRDWHCGYVGPLLIHASKWFNAEEVYEAAQGVKRMRPAHEWRLPPPTIGELRALGGHIVGVVEMIGCVEQSPSPWFEGRFGFVLERPWPLSIPYPIRGQLGLFEAPSPEELGPQPGHSLE